MTDAPKPPNRRRRRIVVVVAVLVLVLGLGWWVWPRGDARFVGKWNSTSTTVKYPGVVVRLASNGVGESYFQGKRFCRFHWWVENEQFVTQITDTPWQELEFFAHCIVDSVTGYQRPATRLNIANIDTPGYVRKVVDQASSSTNGVGAGVRVEQIRLSIDRFLQAAGISAAADAGAASAAASLWDQTQGLFGDPSESTSFFASLDGLFSAFSTLAASPTSSAATLHLWT